ncbi:methionyl-tRNA formyltransferase [Paraferrimonas sp. SM1919]|uniref:methionyl-tRNA formyltransferase n=1 Tax=Paraferrimonas sp. SM1919 TaxID=2662263 RepID=UPI0013D0575E|nr:methionyl-tRNA formyltransferase [Paraferrimonas sp. SM1919]
MSLNIVFAGTPEFAADHLQALLNSEHNVVAVYSQPDRPAGRGKKLQASAVKALALKHELPIYQPTSLRSADAQAELAALNADVMVVVAYGLILPIEVLETPKLGCLNVHGSILPKWRGAAPIQRSIWAGDQETGVTIMQMDVGLDTGDMLLIEKCAIEDTDTSASLYTKLAAIGPKALIDCLAKLEAGKLTPEKQDDNLANYAEKLSKEEAKLDWSKDAKALNREVRAFNPWPISHFALEGNSIKVHQAVAIDCQQGQVGEIISADKSGLVVRCGEGALRIESLQLPGKRRLDAGDVINARKDWFTPGTILEQ